MNKIDYLSLGKIWPKGELTKQLFKSNFKKQVPLYFLAVVFVALIVMYTINFNKIGLITSIICLVLYLATLIITLWYKIHIGLKASKKIIIERYLLVTDLYIDLILKNKQKENVIRVLYSNLKVKNLDEFIILKFNKNKLKIKKSLFKEETLNYILENGNR